MLTAHSVFVGPSTFPKSWTLANGLSLEVTCVSPSQSSLFSQLIFLLQLTYNIVLVSVVITHLYNLQNASMSFLPTPP